MRKSHFISRFGLLFVAGLVGGCVGAIDGARDAGGKPGDPAAPTVSPSGPSENDPDQLAKACVPGQISAGPAPLRRLTRAEYDATVSALVGEGAPFGASLEGDETVGPFSANTQAPVSESGVEKYGSAATTLAARALATLASLAPCSVTAADAVCAQTFLQDFGQKVYRRPLAPAELDRYLSLFTAGSTNRTFADGIRLALQAMLQSPNFLYHVELGQPLVNVSAALPLAALDSHEVAARLSFLLWSGRRDAALDAAADSGRLTSAAAIEAEARRMLSAPQAKAAMQSFHSQLTGVGYLDTMPKSQELYPEWTPELAKALSEEPGLFADAVIREGDGSLASLFTASFTVAGPLVGQFYGASGSGPRYQLDAAQRTGLLTLPGLMAAHSSVDQSNPVKRAVWVREALLCQELVPPPNDAVLELPKVDPNVSTRERFRQHRDDRACAGCHTLLDPVGLGFEHYDAIGRYRAQDAGMPVDASGEIAGEPAAIAGAFNGAIELAQKLASSPAAQHCMGRHWFRYALGREPSAEDNCARANALEKFSTSGGNIRELIVAIATSDSFRFRKVEP